MAQNYFAGMPSINIPRSKFSTHYNVPMTFKHGLLVPVDFIPILPGDGMNFLFKDLNRMQTPIAPIFGNIKEHFAAFFVPYRLVWNHTEEFFGANKTSAGYQTSTYQFPSAGFYAVEEGSLSHYLGKPYKASADTDADGKTYYKANILKERAYYLIWNEYFRAQQITNPVILNFGDGAAGSSGVTNFIGSWNGTNINPGDGSNSLMRVSKEFDYFTASTISPQYGAAVELPLGSTAKLTLGPAYQVAAADASGQALPYLTPQGVDDTSSVRIGYTSASGTTTSAINSNVYVNLENATAAKVNDVRYAFAVQKYLERANFAGNYFFGILQVHYGVTSPDSRLQRPEFLGEWSSDILVHQVVATADTTNTVGGQSVKTSVGNTGAMSVTASGMVSLFDKAFVEPGFVCIVKWCRARQIYSQGVMREDNIKDKFEIYSPEFCNLGDQLTLTRELYWKAGESEGFGYQEHWAELRYRPDRVSGMLDPNVPNSLDFWTLANKFTTKPELNDDFIMEGRATLDRALVTGSSADEYISDTYIELHWTREMPVRTIPGLIDHFGAM